MLRNSSRIARHLCAVTVQFTALTCHWVHLWLIVCLLNGQALVLNYTIIMLWNGHQRPIDSQCVILYIRHIEEVTSLITIWPGCVLVTKLSNTTLSEEKIVTIDTNNIPIVLGQYLANRRSYATLSKLIEQNIRLFYFTHNSHNYVNRWLLLLHYIILTKQLQNHEQLSIY